MGVWGTGIYSNDTAADVKDLCDEVYPYVTVDEANKIIFQEFQEIVSATTVDNEVASFWYALADWQWSHGVLKKDIYNKTMELLNDYAGIDEWKESCTKEEVRNRIYTLKKLKNKLQTSMCPPNLPKGKLQKPKHKTGDIVVFKAYNKEQDVEDIWTCDIGDIPFLYASRSISQSPTRFRSTICAQNKYLALLCIGKETREHSEYIKGLYDEYSVYVFYDYCDEKEPTLEILKKCGFLPTITHSYNTDERKFENIGWTYGFITESSFRANSITAIKDIKKIRSIEEFERFESLFSNKQYSHNPIWCLDLYHAFSEFFQEKTRLLNLNIEIDNLLGDRKQNPRLLTEIKHRTGDGSLS